MGKERSGVIYAVSAYIIWGFLPIFWKSLADVSSIEILLSRILWAFIFTVLLIVLMRNGHQLTEDLKTLWQSQRSFWSLFLASLLISGNWFLYIWAVNHGFIVQTSLGYYINPLMSVLLGVFFLKEKLSKAQTTAFLLATVGVVILTVSYGSFPFLSFALAISFALYGLIKKSIQLDALRVLAIETLFIMPIALGYYIWLFLTDSTVFLQVSLKIDLLLVLTGVATALPLVLFAKGAQRMPLYMVGFLQYIAPTIMLFLGVVIYSETFGKTDLISFIFIWAGILLFTASKVLESIRTKQSHP